MFNWSLNVGAQLNNSLLLLPPLLSSMLGCFVGCFFFCFCCDFLRSSCFFFFLIFTTVSFSFILSKRLIFVQARCKKPRAQTNTHTHTDTLTHQQRLIMAPLITFYKLENRHRQTKAVYESDRLKRNVVLMESSRALKEITLDLDLRSSICSLSAS